MQVEEHLIDAPVADQIDDIAVGSVTEESYGACGTEGLIGDILSFKAQVWSAELDVGLEGIVEHSKSYIFPPPRWRHDAG